MKLSTTLCLIGALITLTACGGSSMRPTYSGKQESTEGVPGFVKGKKVSEHVKLGQSYTVAGETYVPRHQPDYVEEGKASWYGPGFHGGKTANGERFDEDELTAAHRTLPLPSIVRVTMLSTGKQVVVRVNDRGPFAHSRIIDLSRGAAEKIGLLRAGVAKVRVEYMEKESARFAELLAQGRSPKSIDVASEVLGYDNDGATNYARADVRNVTANESTSSSNDTSDSSSGSFWDRFSPVRNAEASTPRNPQQTNQAAPVSEVESSDLASPEPIMASAPAQYQPAAPKLANTTSDQVTDPNDNNYSPFSMLDDVAPAPQKVAPSKVEMAALNPAQYSPATKAPSGATYVQLGAFKSAANAEKLRQQFSGLSDLKIEQKPSSNGTPLYHVRMGPYTDAQSSSAALEKASNAGADARIIRE